MNPREIIKLHPLSGQTVIIDSPEGKDFAEFQLRKLEVVSGLLETMGIDSNFLELAIREKQRGIISMLKIPEAIYDTNKVRITAFEYSREPLRYEAFYEIKHQGLLPLKGYNMIVIRDFFLDYYNHRRWVNFDLGWDSRTRSVDMLVKGGTSEQSGKIIGLRFIEDFHRSEEPITGTVAFIAL